MHIEMSRLVCFNTSATSLMGIHGSEKWGFEASLEDSKRYISLCGLACALLTLFPNLTALQRGSRCY